MITRLRIAVILLAAVFLSFFVNGYSDERGGQSNRPPHRIPDLVVWNYLSARAIEHDLDPQFVYALAWAESSLDANAENESARGIMQVTKSTWSDMTNLPFEMAWDYKTNIDVAVDYLVFCKALLMKHQQFNLPLLAASYRYGPYKVKRKKYRISELEVPTNDIYRSIFQGQIHPIQRPWVSKN